MAQTNRRSWLKGLLIVSAVALVIGVAFNALYLADLRPESLRTDDSSAREAGAKMLADLASAHGLEAWERYQVMDVRFEDRWHGDMVQRLLMHWTESPQTIHGRFVRGSWTGELELLSGPDRGERWGIQGWRTWTTTGEGEPEFEHDDTIEFVIPTTQYFFELPLRIPSATVALPAGSGQWKGKPYDLVFATWKSPEPLAEVDQYLLWIDPTTGLLARVDYTVRDQGGVAVGTAHYRDYEDFQGVILAKEIAIFGRMPGGNELPIHTFSVESIDWDTVPVDALRPDPTIPHEGESKPNP